MQAGLGLAEVPDAIWVPAHPSRYRPRAAAATPYDFVVIHITSGHPDPMGVARMWAAPAVPPGTLGTSAHLVVGDAQVIQCVALRYAAEHAHRANDRSIGIEHTAREPGEWGHADKGMPPTPNLYARSARLVAYLLKAGGLPVARGVTIKGHAEADPVTTHTGCPDKAPWDWPYYIGMVQAAYERIGEAPRVA